jgi:hypothetical protein
MERKCSRESCSVHFLPKREMQVHCSAACRRLAWNESRVTMRISKEAAKKKTLASESRNPVLAIGKSRLLALPLESKRTLRSLAVELAALGKKKARECSRLENFHDAEHWRALSVFADQIRGLLAR